MKTAAVLSSLIMVGSLTFAAGQSRVAVSDTPLSSQIRTNASFVGGMPPAPSKRGGDGGVAALVMGDNCTFGEPLNWFTTVHPLPECAELIWGGQFNTWANEIDGSAEVDADGDGTKDRLVMLGSAVVDGSIRLYRHFALYVGSVPAGDYPPVGDHALYKVDYSASDSGFFAVLSPVMSGSVLLDALCSVTSPCGASVLQASFFVLALSDIDGDGDRDLVLRIWVMSDEGAGWIYTAHRVWIENTAKTNPPLAADINGDGVVDGKDLASVIAAWTP